MVYISRKFTPLLLFYDSQHVLYIKHKVILPHILTVVNSLDPGWEPPPPGFLLTCICMFHLSNRRNPIQFNGQTRAANSF